MKDEAMNPSAHGLLLGSIQEGCNKVAIRDILPLSASADSPEIHDYVSLWPMSNDAPISAFGYYCVASENVRADLFQNLPGSILLVLFLRFDKDGELLQDVYSRSENGCFEQSADVGIPAAIGLSEGIDLPRVPVTSFHKAAQERDKGTSVAWLQLAVAAVAGSVLTLFCVHTLRPAPEPEVRVQGLKQKGPNRRSTLPVPVAEPVLPATPLAYRELDKLSGTSKSLRLPLPGFILPTQPPQELPEPPHVKIWYAAPDTTTYQASTKPESRGAMLVQPFLETPNSK